MKFLITHILFFAFLMKGYCQKIECGNYRLCYETYWKCHFQNLIELSPDSTYKFIYRDDVQSKSSNGKWRIDPGFLILTPCTISDTIAISIMELLNFENVIRIGADYKSISNIEVSLFQKELKRDFLTDSAGEFRYRGEIADSLSFKIKDRKFSIFPKKELSHSLLWIMLDLDHKDLIYEQLGINKIVIENGKMLIRYIDDEDEQLKTEYFEKIN